MEESWIQGSLPAHSFNHILIPRDVQIFNSLEVEPDANTCNPSNQMARAEGGQFAVSLVYLANARLAGDILSQMSNSIKQRPRAQVSRETRIQIRRLAHRCYERKNLATAERGQGDRKFLLGW